MFPEEKCLLKFADQFNFSLKMNHANPDFDKEEFTHQKVYDVKIEDGSLIKYEIYLVNEQRASKFFLTKGEEDFRFWPKKKAQRTFIYMPEVPRSI
jgi:hypothetical protein